jgi:hypothetical protein
VQLHDPRLLSDARAVQRAAQAVRFLVSQRAMEAADAAVWDHLGMGLT